MDRSSLRTIQDCEDLLEGALWMGTGGGGSFDAGLELLLEVIEEGLPVEWVDADLLPDDSWTVTVGLHGSIAPLSPEVKKEIGRVGLREQTDEWYIVKAVREFADYLGHRYDVLVPAELGPESVAISIAAAARLGIPVVDGDYIGRAVPEETQSTYCLYEKQSSLFAGVDRWGNVILVKKAVSDHALERIAKMLAIASYGDIAVATTPLVAEDMKKILVRGTLTRCLEIGRVIRSSKNNGLDPIDGALEAICGWRLFEGTVNCLETDDRDGYMFGTTHIEGVGRHEGQTLAVWFKNENLVSWLNGDPWICSPDLLTLVYKDGGRGIYNAELKEGDEVVVIGMKGVEGFRTKAGLNLAGPKHFGFDIEYVPIEELVTSGQVVQLEN